METKPMSDDTVVEGMYTNLGNVVLCVPLGLKLEARPDHNGQRQHYLPCDVCRVVEPVPWVIPHHTCADCNS